LAKSFVTEQRHVDFMVRNRDGIIRWQRYRIVRLVGRKRQSFDEDISLSEWLQVWVDGLEDPTSILRN